MKQRAMTPYQLHQTLAGKVNKQTVYNFLQHGRVIKSDTLAHVLTALDLTIRPSTQRKKP